ncbi:ribosome biogenesis protein Nop16 [Russula compacta]|nr:ribosome biogenesis protein Nop16 [Russula compacta]
MANPRQRRKTRTRHRPVHHSRQAKKLLKKQPPIRGPKVIQEAWDKYKTVRQNYAALGLAVSSNPSTSGGTECAASVTEARTVANEAPFIDGSEPAVSTSGGSGRDLPRGLGRIIRDEDGRIIAVETNGDVDPSLPNHRLDFIEAMAAEAAMHAPENQCWLSFGRASDTEQPKAELIQSLPDAFLVPVPRFSSKGEARSLQRLISKHGRDVAAMMRDRRLNPDQRTEGEIRRAIKKAGGFERLGGRIS